MRILSRIFALTAALVAAVGVAGAQTPKEEVLGLLNLDMPELAEVKAYVKAEKARRKGEGIKNAGPVCWDFGEGLPYVDARYLIDALELLPGCTCRISEKRPVLGGLYLESPAGDGLVMAKRRPKKAE